MGFSWQGRFRKAEAAPFQGSGRLKGMDETDYIDSGIALALRRREEHQHSQFLGDVVEVVLNFGCDEEHGAN